MNSTSIPTGISQLKVFCDGSHQESSEQNHSNQLPFIETLIDQFELVTGWQLSFSESQNNFRRRSNFGDDSTVFGNLQIRDLSESVHSGRPAGHRGYCDQLAETLDGMVRTIQSDRERFQEIGRCVNPVVDVPFDWWGIQGNSGFNGGAFSSWSITNDEKIRFFAGQLHSDDSANTALAAAMVLSAFETACLTSLPLHEIAPILPAIVQKSAQTNSRLDWFTTIELDPITGGYEWDGFNSAEGLTIVDVHTSTALEMENGENEGTLYSGQIMGVGVNRNEMDRMNDLIADKELTVDHCLQILAKQFPQSPAIFLYRE